MPANPRLWRHLDRLEHGDDDQQNEMPPLPEYRGDADVKISACQS
jgi:hypothetical protein